MLLICMSFNESLIDCPVIYKYLYALIDKKELKDEIYAQLLK